MWLFFFTLLLWKVPVSDWIIHRCQNVAWGMLCPRVPTEEPAGSRCNFRIPAEEPPGSRCNFRIPTEEPPGSKCNFRIPAEEPPGSRCNFRIPAEESSGSRSNFRIPAKNTQDPSVISGFLQKNLLDPGVISGFLSEWRIAGFWSEIVIVVEYTGVWGHGHNREDTQCWNKKQPNKN